jgi:hypothetical protein
MERQIRPLDSDRKGLNNVANQSRLIWMHFASCITIQLSISIRSKAGPTGGSFRLQAEPDGSVWWDTRLISAWQNSVRSLIRSNGWAHGDITPMQIIRVLGERLPIRDREEVEIEKSEWLHELHDRYEALSGQPPWKVRVETKTENLTLQRLPDGNWDFEIDPLPPPPMPPA